MHNARIGRLRGNRKTELAAHLQHRLVLAQNLADELPNAALPAMSMSRVISRYPRPRPFQSLRTAMAYSARSLSGSAKKCATPSALPSNSASKRQFAVVVELRQPRSNCVGQPVHWR